MPQAIHTENLTRRFGRITAMDRVNLDVPEGALYALVGQNGAGKTTTIKVLMNLIPAMQGSATILGTDSRNIRGKSYNQIGYVSENQEIPEWDESRIASSNTYAISIRLGTLCSNNPSSSNSTLSLTAESKPSPAE